VKKMDQDLYILDCDPGIDDAMALLQLIAAKKARKANLLCITIVNGNCSVEDGTRNACRVLDTVHVDDVPIYKGAQQPLVGNERNYDPYAYHGQNGFNDVPFDDEPNQTRVQDEKAWVKICELTKKYPNAITLIAIGPLTNIALAIHHDPEVLSRVKDFFIMGGNTEGMGNVSMAAEYNFHIDPEAASLVLKSIKCPTYIAAWELCRKYVHLTLDWRKKNLGHLTTESAKLMNKLEQVWFGNYLWEDQWMLADQLAMTAALYRESMQKTTVCHAEVELGGHLTRGMMVLDKQPIRATEPNVIIIDQLDETLIQKSLSEAFSL